MSEQSTTAIDLSALRVGDRVNIEEVGGIAKLVGCVKEVGPESFRIQVERVDSSEPCDRCLLGCRMTFRKSDGLLRTGAGNFRVIGIV